MNHPVGPAPTAARGPPTGGQDRTGSPRESELLPTSHEHLELVFGGLEEPPEFTHLRGHGLLDLGQIDVARNEGCNRFLRFTELRLDRLDVLVQLVVVVLGGGSGGVRARDEPGRDAEGCGPGSDPSLLRRAALPPGLPSLARGRSRRYRYQDPGRCSRSLGPVAGASGRRSLRSPGSDSADQRAPRGTLNAPGPAVSMAGRHASFGVTHGGSVHHAGGIRQRGLLSLR